MATPTQPLASALKSLSSKGAKLHTAGMHLRRTDNKQYVATHDLRDKHGNAPADGQKATMENSHGTLEELLAAVKQHMGQDPDAAEDASEQPAPAQ